MYTLSIYEASYDRIIQMQPEGTILGNAGYVP